MPLEQAYMVPLVLLSASLHAFSSAMLKSYNANRAFFVVCFGITSVIALPFIPLLPLPTGITWLWLALALAAHFFYQLTLVYAYNHGDYSLVYPLSRGIAPLATALGGYVFLQETLALPAWLGIVIITAGLAVLANSALSKAFDKHNLTAVILAILCGLSTVAYTLLDAAGVRSTTNAFTYIVWLFALDGLVMIGLLFVKDGQNIKQEMPKLWRIGIFGGVMAFLGYGCMILALRLGASATVASLRTLSVLFATLIGVFFFKETMGKQRICAAILIIIGAIILSYA